MELPTPVPPAKRLCSRDASVRGSDERSISSTGKIDNTLFIEMIDDR